MNKFIATLISIIQLNFGVMSSKSKVGILKRDSKGRRIGHSATKVADDLGAKAIPQSKKEVKANWVLDLTPSYNSELQVEGSRGEKPNANGELVVNGALLGQFIEKCFHQLKSDGVVVDAKTQRAIIKLAQNVTLRSKASAWVTTRVNPASGNQEVALVKIKKFALPQGSAKKNMDL